VPEQRLAGKNASNDKHDWSVRLAGVPNRSVARCAKGNGLEAAHAGTNTAPARSSGNADQRISIDGDGQCICTWRVFCEANADGFAPWELREIGRFLKRYGHASSGAAGFVLRIVR
jgi:hypothetical protein